MSTPYVGEIRMFGFGRVPNGWFSCDGSLQPISEYEVLYTLIGTTYGGDGESTFALPDLRGRVPIHQGTGASGSNYILAETGGVEEVTLTVNQIPNHGHPLLCSTDPASQRSPQAGLFARAGAEAYASEFTAQVIAPTTVSPAGGSQPHTNFQPYLCVNFIISLFGIFP